MLCKSSSRIRDYILKSSRLGSRSRENNSIIHGSVLLKHVCYLCYSRSLLADTYIDTDNIITLLVKDGICCYGSLTGLSVTDDKLSLSSCYREHGIYGKDTRLHGNGNRLSCNDGRCIELDRSVA